MMYPNKGSRAWKILTHPTAHTYIAQIRKYPPGEWEDLGGRGSAKKFGLQGAKERVAKIHVIYRDGVLQNNYHLLL